MANRFYCHDSLLAERTIWRTVAPDGFEMVIGNPPWEKVKTTRHEFLRANGETRHYGAAYTEFDSDHYTEAQRASEKYAHALANRFSHAHGEIDLYIAFLELSMELVRFGGRISILLPAGLIRSQRSSSLRRFVLKESSKVAISILDNRARFFAIDSRFKFLTLSCIKKSSAKEPTMATLLIKHAKGTEKGVVETASAKIEQQSLEEIRPDFSIPEIRGEYEWNLFLKMSRNGETCNRPGSQWLLQIVREVDMTRDRKNFRSDRSEGCIPVVEGRMVQQHRFGSKNYVSGSGRSAIWNALPIGHSKIKPQFFAPCNALSHAILERTRVPRAGFCDITGQTNERSMMAALIPPGVVCGNKVPTITFPNDSSEERLLLWIGVANSLPFDWLLRQVVTTTVNYFVLLGIPMPDITKESLPGREIISATRRLQQIDMGVVPPDAAEMGELRAKIDVAVAVAYGLALDEIELLLQNFPLLDRGQPRLPGEEFSTITKDLIRFAAAKRMRHAGKGTLERIKRSLALGAFPYVPAEHIAETNDSDKSVARSESFRTSQLKRPGRMKRS